MSAAPAPKNRWTKSWSSSPARIWCSSPPAWAAAPAPARPPSSRAPCASRASSPSASSPSLSPSKATSACASPRSGIAELQQFVHTLIVIPNQNLFRVANDRTTFAQAFAMADEVLHAGVRGVTDLIVMPGLINLDFADIKIGDLRDGQGDDGHRRGRGRGPRPEGRRHGDLQPAARRCVDEGRAAACSSTSPAGRI